MKIIQKGNLKREQITNIEQLEEVVGATIEEFNVTQVDLENGRYADIISYLDTVRDIVTVSIREVGIATKKVFLEDIYHTHQGKYGIEITPDGYFDEKIQTEEMFDTYDKYKSIIDEMVLKTFERNIA